ncbi:PREDICTED: mitochondrial amidoxime-reducing component 1 [Lepidothrix coronata]|uniref:Mitochondrial amidoxime-reducing component 1 n=1 Tax=Lepidothrix coronata TaxID=321398 RepID=A0A6J0H3L5_9PASS|nr:PREDICTED: mitochondrial amidoxime-reducing component 1 [Lepidothrix coronata]
MSGLRGSLGPARPGWVWGAAALLALGALLGAWRWAGRRRRRRLQRVGTVLRLFVYPVKSCKGVSVRRAQVTPMGLRSGDMRDRFWLVITEDGHMVTARQEPRLVLVSVGCDNGHLTFEAPDMEKLCLPVNVPRKNPVHNCRVFGQDIQGRDCGDEVAQWITTFLKSQPYRLVHFEPSMVPRKSKNTINLFRSTDEVNKCSFSQKYFLLTISHPPTKTCLFHHCLWHKSRTNPCNTAVHHCISDNVLDTWEDILIGDVEMKGTVCCGRCILTTVNPDTGVLDRKEPLETLKSYRLCDPSERHIYKTSPLFGKYFAVDKTGTIQVGDPVYKMIWE